MKKLAQILQDEGLLPQGKTALDRKEEEVLRSRTFKKLASLLSREKGWRNQTARPKKDGDRLVFLLDSGKTKEDLKVYYGSRRIYQKLEKSLKQALGELPEDLPNTASMVGEELGDGTLHVAIYLTRHDISDWAKTRKPKSLGPQDLKELLSDILMDMQDEHGWDYWPDAEDLVEALDDNKQLRGLGWDWDEARAIAKRLVTRR